MLACYGQSYHSMTGAWEKVWTSRVGQSIAGAPKLTTLPPTNEVLGENVVRAHLQVAIWRHALESDPLSLHPTSYGWEEKIVQTLSYQLQSLKAPYLLLSSCYSSESDDPVRVACHVIVRLRGVAVAVVLWHAL